MLHVYYWKVNTLPVTEVDKYSPNAITIGAFIGAEEARTIISIIPYKIDYIFRPDHMEIEGQYSIEYLVTIGCIANPNITKTAEKDKPIKISKSEMNNLTEVSLSDTEFQRKLRNITKFE